MASIERSPSGHGYPDLHDHLDALEKAGLLIRVTRPINKDTEMHPLVRWQFRGGIPEAQRKAFLFENVVDSKGNRYPMPVAVGCLAANPQIYSLGMGCDVAEIGERWRQARSAPIPSVEVSDGCCQEVVITGDTLSQPGHGVDSLPVPISTPGWDNAPYLTCAHFVSKDPETGVQNVGNYRSMLKAPNRVGVNAAIELTAGMYYHWKKAQAMGKPLECAIVVGGPPAYSFASVQKLPPDLDEAAVAGALVGRPLNMVRAKTVDLLVPAESEIVIEGLVSTDAVEPEGPFGESHGHVALPENNPFMTVTAITHRKNAVFVSIISQVTPSESSVIKRVAMEPALLNHLRNVLGIRSVAGVSMHEPLTNIRKLIVLQMKEPRERDVWQALFGVTSYNNAIGKIVVAVDTDIDPNNLDAIFWAIAYRSRPHVDMQIIRGKDPGHVPRGSESQGSDRESAPDSALLVNATLKEKFAPISLPKREYMEGAMAIWEELGLPALRPEAPWFGYSLGQWPDEYEEEAQKAVQSDWFGAGERCVAQRKYGGEPNTDL